MIGRKSPSEPTDVSFADALKGFRNFYIFLIVACALMAVIAILLAVYVHPLGGLAVALILCLCYRIFLPDELSRRLGLSYRRVSDGIALSVKTAKREEIELPSRLMGLDVTALEAPANTASAASVRLLRIPSSLLRIDPKAFSAMPVLEELVFDGDREALSSLAWRSGIDLTPYRVTCTHSAEEEVSL